MSSASERTFPPVELAHPTSPPLKWAGGKRWQLRHLQPLLRDHAHRRLVEPFCGGLAVSMGLRPRQALLNDINPHVINFYRWLQAGLKNSLPMENDEQCYYGHRERFNALLTNGRGDSPEAALLFYYLNRTGYNGLCRFNKSGRFNVPFGRYASINYRQDFSEYQHAFRGWKFASQDFESLKLRPGDLVYADPPYDVPFTQYAKEDFTWEDQVRLAEWLAVHPGPVVLSNQATARVIRLYRKLGFRLKFLDAPRMINCTGDRTPAKEVLAIKNL